MRNGTARRSPAAPYSSRNDVRLPVAVFLVSSWARITSEYVRQRLEDVVKDEDLSKFIL